MRKIKQLIVRKIKQANSKPHKTKKITLSGSTDFLAT